MQKRRHARRCTRKGVEVIGSEEVVMARLGKRIKLKLLENHVRNRLKTEWLVGDLSLEREGRLMGSLAVMIAAHALALNLILIDRKSTRLNSSHRLTSRMPSS